MCDTVYVVEESPQMEWLMDFFLHQSHPYKSQESQDRNQRDGYRIKTKVTNGLGKRQYTCSTLLQVDDFYYLNKTSY